LFHDISFKTLDGKVCNGHRVLLHSNSGFFEALFDSAAEGNFSGEIPLELSFDEMLVVKQFLYGCQVLLSEHNSCHIFEIANKNLIDGLEQLAEDFIRKNIELFDPFRIYQFSKKFNANSLMEFCIWYFKVNFTTVSKDPSFADLPAEFRSMLKENQWPGEEYHKDYHKWELAVAEYGATGRVPGMLYKKKDKDIALKIALQIRFKYNIHITQNIKYFQCLLSRK